MYERFYEFGLSDEILKSLSDMGFEEPTQIQKLAIPPLMMGRDVIGMAQTGTGKTAAFGIPIVEKNIRGRLRKPCALVLVPTRELAMQVAQEMNRLGKDKGFVSIPIYGGQSIERQIKSLLKGIDLVVGTPGRLIDHIQRKTLVLSEVSSVVLDEADEMLNMGFIDDIETILKETPPTRQTMLFSATMPAQIVRISKKYMSSPKKVGVDAKELVVAKINQVFYEVRRDDKIRALTRIIDVQAPELTLIFCHTKREVDDLSGRLHQMGYDAGAIHGDFTQSYREEIMRQFKGGELDILVATDVAARGLDINDVTHVINYSIPQNPEAYVHRIGRTGRAGKSGIAITFVTPREYTQLRLIEKTAGTKIAKGQLPSGKQAREAKAQELTGSLESVIREGRHKELVPLVGELSEKFEPQEVAAAALSLAAGDLGGDGEAEESKGQEAPEASGMTRLFLTIGKRHKFKVGDIVRTISEKSSMPGQSIGKVAVFDKYSFVEVPADMAEQVIGSINDMMVGGR
ncbi:MAG: DEAD/DEAH box helicase, partial [Nitrospirota bacterium]